MRIAVKNAIVCEGGKRGGKGEEKNVGSSVWDSVA